MLHHITEDQIVGFLSRHSLWRGFPFDQIFLEKNLDVGYGILDTFMQAGGPVATNVGGWSGWKTYEDTGWTVLPKADGRGLVITADTTTDNEEAWVQAGYGAGGPFKISASAPKELIFECGVYWDTIADSKLGSFVGLMQPGCAITDLMADATCAIAAKSYVGFHRLYADGDAVDFVHRDSAGSETTAKADMVTLAASTLVRLGFRFNQHSKVITPYVNGVEVPSGKISAATVAGATFPNGDALNILLGMKRVTASGGGWVMTVPWVACAQLA